MVLNFFKKGKMGSVFDDKNIIFQGQELFSFESMPNGVNSFLKIEDIVSQLNNELINEAVEIMGEFRRDSLLNYLGLISASGLPNFSGEYNRGFLNCKLSTKQQMMAGRVLLEIYFLSAPCDGKREVDNLDELCRLLRIALNLINIDSAKNLILAGKGEKYNGKIKPYMGGVSISQDIEGKNFKICYNPLHFSILEAQKGHDLILDTEVSDEIRIKKIINQESHDREGLSVALLKEFNFSLFDLFSVFSDLIEYCKKSSRAKLNFPQNFALRKMEYVELIDIFGLDTERRERVIEYLVFSNEKMTIEDMRPSSTRHQKIRIFTNPILKIDGYVYIIGEHILHAWNRWAQYIRIGDWPMPEGKRRSSYPLLSSELTKIRGENGKLVLEKKFEYFLSQKSIIFGRFGDGSVIGECKLPGEVDGIILDSDNEKIIVVECKDIASDMNILSMQIELLNFENDFTEKLSKKVAQVEKDKISVSKAIISFSKDKYKNNYSGCAVNDTWKVEGLFVVRDGSPAIYYSKMKYPVMSFMEFRSIYG